MTFGERQYQVGSGIGYRFLTFAGPAVWHLNYGTPDATLLLPFTLGWTLLFGILLARTMKRVRKRDKRAANRLLRRDILMVCIVCFLPNLLRPIPGSWEVFLTQMAIVPPLRTNCGRSMISPRLPNVKRTEPLSGGSVFFFRIPWRKGRGHHAIFTGL